MEAAVAVGMSHYRPRQSRHARGLGSGQADGEKMDINMEVIEQYNLFDESVVPLLKKTD